MEIQIKEEHQEAVIQEQLQLSQQQKRNPTR